MNNNAFIYLCNRETMKHKMNPLNDNNNANLAVQGSTATYLSGIMYDQYLNMFPWFLAAIPLIILDLRLGRARAQLDGERVTINKSIRMTIDKTFTYICWIMISTSLSYLFGHEIIKYSILAIVYGLEVASCFSKYLRLHYGITIDMLDFVRMFCRFLWQRATGIEQSFENIIKEHSNKQGS